MKTIIIDDNTVSVDGVLYERKAVEFPEFILLNGIKWETKNIEDYHNFYEANGIAAVNGKRLPTKEEFEQLNSCFKVWDSNLTGYWFAECKADLKNPFKSLFLPAAGYRYYFTGSVYNQGSYGYYWSSTAYSGTLGHSLYFNDAYVGPVNYGSYAYGFAIRCVIP